MGVDESLDRLCGPHDAPAGTRAGSLAADAPPAPRPDRAVLDSIADPVVCWDGGRRLAWTNRAAAEPANQPLLEAFGAVGPTGSATPSLQTAWELALSTGAPARAEVQTDDGRAWLVSLYRVDEGAGQMTEALAFAQDVTEDYRQRAEEERRRSTTVRAQRLESIGVLAGGIAHDLNNILAPVLGFADLVLMDGPAEGPQRHRVEQIADAARRARDVIRQILAFTQPESGDESAGVLVQPVVEETLELLRSSTPATIEIRGEMDAGCGPARIGATELHQVVLNLCANALYAMRHGGGILTVALDQTDIDQALADRVGARAPGAFARLSVLDMGEGMDEAVQARMFEPFYTTKPADQGTGLGLPTVLGIVRNCGGGLTHYSRPGTGTTFHVYLPLAAANGPGPPPSTIEPAEGEHLLVVDDEPAVVTMASEMLRALGYAVTPFGDSLDALEAIRRDPVAFDLVVTDHAMPHLTGVELAASARLARQDLPVLLASGQWTDPSRHPDTVCEVLTKPYSMAELAMAVRRSLRSGPCRTHGAPSIAHEGESG